MGIFEGEKEVLAFADDYYSPACGVANNLLERLGSSSIYIHVILGGFCE